MQVLEEIGKCRVLPVIVLEDAKAAAPLAQALCEGGLPCGEITFRTEAAQEAIRIMKTEFPEMLIGAGTVLTVEQVDRATEAGAVFIVTPGFDPEIVDYCIQKAIPVIPGCVTPSELAQAVKRGLKVVKFFPAESFGGVAAIRALAAPYRGLYFLPTGGIHEENLTAYLSCEKVLACGGSFMVKEALIRSGSFEEIRVRTKKTVEQIKALYKNREER